MFLLETTELYYRESDNERYSIQPDDGTTAIRISYVKSKGVQYILTLTPDYRMQLITVCPEETIAGIKERAPKVFMHKIE